MRKTFMDERPCGRLAGLSLAVVLSGCAIELEELATVQDSVVDVPHTSVERQSIGNCWLYSHASWIESMHLTSTGAEIDLSQSYWTYWHWFDQITGSLSNREGEVEISTGGSFGTANGIVRRYGLVEEVDFVDEDLAAEISWRQYYALERINESLAHGALGSRAARKDRALVRAELDAAWALSPDVVAVIDEVFGASVTRTLDGSGTARASVGETAILAPGEFPVAYVRRQTMPEAFVPVQTTLSTAIAKWRTVSYSRGDRNFLVRMQRALHQRQPVVLTWNVDFNAMESGESELRGSFNLQTLAAAGSPGRQGGHMVLLEDYEAVTAEFGVLAAGETLDPEDPEDQARLTAALRPDTEIRFLRVKNSWGTLRPDRASAPGFPGYHDLYMDYLDGPIAWCPSADRTNPDFPCTGSSVPLRSAVLPPGF